MNSGKGLHKMKKTIISVCLLTISIFSTPSLSKANDAEIERLMHQFFFNVSNGYGNSAVAFLTDPILSERERQLKNNPAYAKFLRKIHANATLRVMDIVDINQDTKTVDVEILHQGEAIPEKLRYVVKRDKNRWKISDEIRP